MDAAVQYSIDFDDFGHSLAKTLNESGLSALI